MSKRLSVVSLVRGVKAISLILLVGLLITACATRVGDINNACSIMQNQRSWYKDLQQVERDWQVPPAAVLAIIHQESKFKANAKPPRKRLFGFIPTVRPSSAFGYPQALDSTWDEYRKKRGRFFAQRDDFSDAADFIGWYLDASKRQLDLPIADVRGHYLAYHEGRGGYSRGTYQNKGWLLSVADKVKNRAAQYDAQLTACQQSLNRNRWLFF